MYITAASEKEMNQALGLIVGSDKTSISAGKCDKVDKLVSAVELLTKQVSTLQSDINNIKGHGYKKKLSDNFNSGDRRGRNVI